MAASFHNTTNSQSCLHAVAKADLDQAGKKDKHRRKLLEQSALYKAMINDSNPLILNFTGSLTFNPLPLKNGHITTVMAEGYLNEVGKVIRVIKGLNSAALKQSHGRDEVSTCPPSLVSAG